MINLDASVKRVIVQFKMRDPGNLAKIAQKMNKNPKNPSMENGVKMIEYTPDVSMGEFVRQLEAAGFDLVNVLHGEREIEGGGPFRVHHIGRFVFVRKEKIQTALENGQANLARIELHLLCTHSLWRFCGYVNPIRRNGETVEGIHHEVSINLDSRRPLFDNNGNPVRIWGKPKSRRGPGDQPTPIGPKCLLRVENDAVIVVSLIPADQKTEPAVSAPEPSLEPITREIPKPEIPADEAKQIAPKPANAKPQKPAPLRMDFEPKRKRGTGIRQTVGKGVVGWDERDNHF